jgi:predicted Kef-type K+ transport protein
VDGRARYARGVPNDSAPRPATVTGAAVVTALPGVFLTGYGLFQLVAGFAGSPLDRAMAETLGVIYLVFGLGVCWVARGLLRCQAWARTPALMTFLLNFGVAYWMIQGDYYLYAALSIAYGVAGIVLLFAPASHRVLTR